MKSCFFQQHARHSNLAATLILIVLFRYELDCSMCIRRLITLVSFSQDCLVHHFAMLHGPHLASRTGGKHHSKQAQKELYQTLP